MARAEQPGAPPRHSLAQIQTAIESIMSRLSGGKSFDASLAARIAGSIHLAVNDPRNALDVLAGNPAFERMVTEQAPKLADTVNDPAAKRAAALAEEARANISGAPLSDAAKAVLGIGRFGDIRDAGSRGERGGNQFAELRSKSGVTGDTSTGSGTGYSWLTAANQNIPGFSQAQVASAANFLKGVGLSREEVNEDTRHMVHLSKYRKEIGDFIKRKKDIERRKARGEDTSEDEARLEEDKEKARKRMTPEERKHFDDFRALQGANRADVHHDLDRARSSSDERLSARVKAEATMSIVAQTQRRETTIDDKKSVAEVKSEADDVFGAATTSKAETPKATESKAADTSIEKAPAKPTQVGAAKQLKGPAPAG